jgi:hypothetical protein
MTDEEKRAKKAAYGKRWRSVSRPSIKRTREQKRHVRDRARACPEYQAKRAAANAKRDGSRPDTAAKREYYRAIYRKMRAEKPAEYWLWQSAKKRAKAKGWKFSLSESEISVPDRCPVLGIPLVVGRRGVSGDSPSLDRIDNTKGYTPDNIQVISNRANSIKRDATFEEIEALYLHMKSLRDRAVRLDESGNRT